MKKHIIQKMTALHGIVMLAKCLEKHLLRKIILKE